MPIAISGNEDKLELTCPANSLTALQAAVDNGADCVYLNFRDIGKPRHQRTRLNFDDSVVDKSIRYAHDQGRKVLLTLNTYSRSSTWEQSRNLIEHVAQSDIDAIILTDPELMLYVAAHYPGLRVHFSIQEPINHEIINFYRQRFGIARVILPRLLSLSQLEYLSKNTQVEIEVRGIGMPNISHEEHCALLSDTLDFNTQGRLPQLIKMGIHAIKIESQQRSATYIAQMTKFWRQAIDHYQQQCR